MIFIRYYENLIIDKSVQMDIEEIKEMLDDGISIFNIYVICVSPVGNGIMEILDTSNLIKTVNSYKDYGIIAMAQGRKNIENVLMKIIEDWIKDNNNLYFIKKYYNRKCY